LPPLTGSGGSASSACQSGSLVDGLTAVREILCRGRKPREVRRLAMDVGGLGDGWLTKGARQCDGQAARCESRRVSADGKVMSGLLQGDGEVSLI
jgi:hypothetical protein